MMNFLKTNYTKKDLRVVANYNLPQILEGIKYPEEACALYDKHEEELRYIIRHMFNQGKITELRFDYVRDGAKNYKSYIVYLVVTFLACEIVDIPFCGYGESQGVER